MTGGRVVYVVASADVGGAERCLVAWLPRLCALGWEVGAIFVQREGPHADLFRRSGHRVVIGTGQSLRRVGSYATDVVRLRNLIRSVQPRLVHSAAAKGHLYGGSAALGRVRPMWFLHDIPDRSPINRLACRLPGALVANSRATAAAATDRLHRRAAVVHPAVEVSHFHFDPAARSRFRGEVGWQPGDLVAGYVGRLQRWKGVDLFIRGLAAARARGCALRGVVIGSESGGLDRGYQVELRELARDLGLADEALGFLPFLEDPAPAICALDCVVTVPVDPEPFGMMVVEAMAAGRWVIAARAGGHLETLTEETGQLVNPGDHEAVAEALVRVAGRPELRAGAASAGPRRAATFSAEASAGRLAAVYEGLLR